MGYHWEEFWDFLNCFTDLSLEDGLNMLEEHLNEVIQQEIKSRLHLKSAASFMGKLRCQRSKSKKRVWLNNINPDYVSFYYFSQYLFAKCWKNNCVCVKNLIKLKIGIVLIRLDWNKMFCAWPLSHLIQIRFILVKVVTALAFIILSSIIYAAHGHGTASRTFMNEKSSPNSKEIAEENSESFITRSPICDLMNEFERVGFDLADNMTDSGLSGTASSGFKVDDGFDGRAWEFSESSCDEYYTADEGSNDSWQVDGHKGVCNTSEDVPNLLPCGLRGRSSSVSSCSSYKSTHSTPEDTEDICTDVFLAGYKKASLYWITSVNSK